MGKIRTIAIFTGLAGLLYWSGAIYAAEPVAAQDYLNRGRDRFQNGDKAGAEADFTKAIELDPKFGGAYIMRGVAKKAAGNLESALADYDKGLELVPTDANAWYDRGEIKFRLDDYAGADKDFTKAIELNPKDALAYDMRGSARTYIDKKQQAAEEDFAKAIELEPDFPDVYVDRAILRQNMKLIPQAIADLNKALELDKNNYLAYKVRGDCFRDQKDYKSAIADYSKAVELKPGDGDSNIKLAEAYRNAGKLMEAMNSYNKGLSLSPKNITGLEGRALARETLYSDSKGAIADYTQAIALLPANSPGQDRCYCRRGMAKLNAKDLNGALEDANHVLEHNPKLADALFVRGSAQAWLGNRDSARKDLDAAVGINPGLKPRAARVYQLMEKQTALEAENAADQSGTAK
jgi:tetratricopeptide (TPR) repeat protein